MAPSDAAAVGRGAIVSMKPARKQIVVSWLPVVGLCLAIFVQSCFASPEFGPHFLLKDKVLHMAAYGLMAVLFLKACRRSWPERLSSAGWVVVSILFATLYGAGDELHQSFVSARQADGYDLLADFLGSILGSLAYMKITYRRGVVGR
ncbi:MAG: VanZ family protein [Desulfosarcina sp.]